MSLSRENVNIRKSISYVFVFTMIAKIIGFLREMVLSYTYGAAEISDAYLISQNIPGTIFLFVGTGLTTCYIPVYYRVLKEQGKKESDLFTSRILSIVLLFSTAVIMLVCCFTPFVVKIFASGFEGEALYYAVWFTRIGVLSLYFSSIIYVYTSYLQANNVFGMVAFSGIPNTLIVILSIVLSKKYNIWILAIGTILAFVAQSLLLVVSARRKQFRYHFDLDFKHPYIKEFFLLLSPVVIGVSVNELNTLVDRTIASRISVGAISAMTYGNSIIQLVQGGLVQPIITVLYPSIAESVSQGNHKAVEQSVEKVINSLLAVLLPITAVLMIFGRQIISMIYERGAFDAKAVDLTMQAVFFYAIGIIFIGVREIIARLFYANSDTKTPMANATIGMVINIVLNLVLSRFMGVRGLALATSIAAIVTCVVLVADCKKRLQYGRLHMSMGQIMKICSCTVIMMLSSAAIITFLYGLSVNKNISLLVSLMIGSMLYVMIGYVVKIEIINRIVDFGLLKVQSLLRRR